MSIRKNRLKTVITASEASRKPHFWYVFFMNHKMLKIFRKNDPRKKPSKNSDLRRGTSRKIHFWYGFFTDEKMSKKWGPKKPSKDCRTDLENVGNKRVFPGPKKGPRNPRSKNGGQKGRHQILGDLGPPGPGQKNDKFIKFL